MVNLQCDRRNRAILFSSVIIIISIIHFGVGIGITRGYGKYDEIFEQQVGLAGFNIFVGLLSIIVGVIGLVSAILRYPLLSKIAAIGAFIFGVAAFASLIAALALSGQLTTHFRNSLTDNINDYIQDQDAIDIVDKIQSDYQCCGVYLWLDWSRVQLGVGNNINTGRRRRQSKDSSPTWRAFIQAVSRKKRQVVTPGSVYNLPSSYTFNLPLSCCKDGSGTSTGGGSIGGYCTYQSSMSSNSFYVRGCLEPVSNTGFSQIAGIAVINTCLTMLMFVYFGKMIKIFPGWGKPNAQQVSKDGTYQGQQPQQQQNEYSNIQYPYDQNYNYNGQQYQNGMYQGQQQQQYPYDQYYLDNRNSSPYYIVNPPTSLSYH